MAAQVGVAVWPIGLLLSVEVLSRVSWPRGWQWMLARFAGTGAVARGSAIISYGHLRDVLLAWQYDPLGAAVGPLVLDGLMVISGSALLVMSYASRDRGCQTCWLPTQDERRAGKDRSGDIKRLVIVTMSLSLLVPADRAQLHVSTHGISLRARYTRNRVASPVSRPGRGDAAVAP